MAERIEVIVDGDSRPYGRAMDSAERSTRSFGNTVREENAKTVASNDKTSRSVDRFSFSTGKANSQITFFRNGLKLIKWPAAFALGGEAIQGVSALGAGVVGLTSALGPLTGLLVAYPALLGAFGQAAGVVALANVSDLKAAVGGLNTKLDESSTAFKKLSPEAQDFARQLQAAKGPFRELQATAQGPLFAGLESGLKQAMDNFPAFKQVVGETSGVLGDLADQAGHFLGRDGFGRDFEAIGSTNAKLLGNLGDAGFHLVDALRNVLVAAGPFIDWLGKGTDSFAAWVEAETEAGRKTGELGDFFDSTRETMEQVISIGSSLADVLGEIFHAANPLGSDILDALDKGANDLERWANSVEGRNSLRQFFTDAEPSIFEAGRLVGDIVKSFLDLSQTPGLESLLHQIRTELLPALTSVTESTTTAFGPSLIDMLTQASRLFEHLGGSTGPLVLFVESIGHVLEIVNDLIDKVPILGNAFAAALTIRSIGGIAGLGGKGGGGILGLLGLGALASGGAAKEVAAEGAKLGTATKTGFLSGIAAKMGGRGAILAGGAGLLNTLTSASQGDFTKAGSEAGGEIAGGIIGGLMGGLPGALIGSGIGSFLGGQLSGLFESDGDAITKAGGKVGDLFADGIQGSLRGTLKAHPKALDDFTSALKDQIADAQRQIDDLAASGAGAEDSAATVRLQRARDEVRQQVLGMVHDLKDQYGSLVRAGADMSDKQRQAFKDLALAARQNGALTADQLMHLDRAFDNSGHKWAAALKAAADATGETMKQMQAAVGDATVKVSDDYTGMVTISVGEIDWLMSNTQSAAKALGAKQELQWAVTRSDGPGGVVGHPRQQGGIVGGVGSGDTQADAVPPGTFILNREATRAFGFQGGGLMPVVLEPGERKFLPHEVAGIGLGNLMAMNAAVPRFQGGGMAGKAPSATLDGPAGLLTGTGQGALDTVHDAAVDFLAKAMAQAAASSSAGGAAVGSPGGPTGVGTWMGISMANWVIESLRFAAGKGVHPQPTSGYRPGFDPHTVSGTSEHSGTQYPHGAVDFGGYVDPVALRNKMAVVHATSSFKWPLLAPIGFSDDGHASGTGHQLGGLIEALAKGGLPGGLSVPATALNPKWREWYKRRVNPLLTQMETHYDHPGKWVKSWNDLPDEVRAAFAGQVQSVLNPAQWMVYDEDGSVRHLQAGGQVSKSGSAPGPINRPIPAELQRWNHAFAKHVSPDYGGEVMPANLIAAMAEFFGAPGNSAEYITRGESHGRPGAVGNDHLVGGDSFGWGLWQITDHGHSGEDVLVNRLGGYPEMLNPVKNAIVMADMFKARGWAPWAGDGPPNPDDHYTGNIGDLIRAGQDPGSGGGTSDPGHGTAHADLPDIHVGQGEGPLTNRIAHMKAAIKSIDDQLQADHDNTAQINVIRQKLSATGLSKSRKSELEDELAKLREHQLATDQRDAAQDEEKTLRGRLDKLRAELAKHRKEARDRMSKHGLAGGLRGRIGGVQDVIDSLNERIEIADYMYGRDASEYGADYSPTEVNLLAALYSSTSSPNQPGLIEALGQKRDLLEDTIGRLQAQIAHDDQELKNAPKWKREALRANRTRARDLLGGAKSALTDTVGITGMSGDLGTARRALAELAVGTPETDTSAEDSRLQQLADLNASVALSATRRANLAETDLSIFDQFFHHMPGMPFLGAFATGTNGLRVGNTGLAMLHRDEVITPDAQGPYGNTYSAPGSSAGPGEIHLYVDSDLGPLMAGVRAEIDGRQAKITQHVDRSLGRRGRQRAYAPGG